MRKVSLVMYLIIAGVVFGCAQKKNDVFWAKVTNDFSRNSYFVAVKVRMNNKETNYLIDNDDLYYFFHQTKGFDKVTYQKYMIPLLQSNKPISASDTDISKFGFIRLTRNKYVYSEAAKGEELFINKFFKRKVLKERVSNEERNSIINVLYDWHIATRIDDESGYLIID